MSVPAEFRQQITELLNGYDPWRDAEGYTFDFGRGMDAVDWIEDNCTHVKGELGGMPFILDPWEQAITMTLFGWHDAAGNRRYRELFLYIPRKNGKSIFGAAIALFVMDQDGEPGFEAVSAAGDKNQAKLVYELVEGMIRNNPTLTERYRIYKSVRRIIPNFDPISSYAVISADADSKHGGNLHLVLFDELHTQPNRELFDVLETGTGARRQPLFLIMTTAAVFGDNICNERLARAKAIVSGTIKDPTFLPVLFMAPADADWTDIEVWKAANPGFGISLKEEYCRKKIADAQAIPSQRNNILRFHLNIQSTAADIWLSLDDWNACPKDAELNGPCYAGLDLASTDDITALVLFWPETRAIICRFWLPEDTAYQPSRKHYESWIDGGWLTLTAGNVTDYGQVRTDIVRLHKQHNITMLGFDPYNANEIATALYNNHGIATVAVGFTMRNVSEAAKQIECDVRKRQLCHGNNPVLTWMAGNAMVKADDGGNILPSKKHSSGKIDGIAALVTAQAVAIANPKVSSVYESRGLITL